MLIKDALTKNEFAHLYDVIELIVGLFIVIGRFVAMGQIKGNT